MKTDSMGYVSSNYSLNTGSELLHKHERGVKRFLSMKGTEDLRREAIANQSKSLPNGSTPLFILRPQEPTSESEEPPNIIETAESSPEETGSYKSYSEYMLSKTPKEPEIPINQSSASVKSILKAKVEEKRPQPPHDFYPSSRKAVKFSETVVVQQVDEETCTVNVKNCKVDNDFKLPKAENGYTVMNLGSENAQGSAKFVVWKSNLLLAKEKAVFKNPPPMEDSTSDYESNDESASLLHKKRTVGDITASQQRKDECDEQSCDDNCAELSGNRGSGDGVDGSRASLTNIESSLSNKMDLLLNQEKVGDAPNARNQVNAIVQLNGQPIHQTITKTDEVQIRNSCESMQKVLNENMHKASIERMQAILNEKLQKASNERMQKASNERIANVTNESMQNGSSEPLQKISNESIQKVSNESMQKVSDDRMQVSNERMQNILSNRKRSFSMQNISNEPMLKALNQRMRFASKERLQSVSNESMPYASKESLLKASSEIMQKISSGRMPEVPKEKLENITSEGMQNISNESMQKEAEQETKKVQDIENEMTDSSLGSIRTKTLEPPTLPKRKKLFAQTSRESEDETFSGTQSDEVETLFRRSLRTNSVVSLNVMQAQMLQQRNQRSNYKIYTPRRRSRSVSRQRFYRKPIVLREQQDDSMVNFEKSSNFNWIKFFSIMLIILTTALLSIAVVSYGKNIVDVCMQFTEKIKWLWLQRLKPQPKKIEPKPSFYDVVRQWMPF